MNRDLALLNLLGVVRHAVGNLNLNIHQPRSAP